MQRDSLNRRSVLAAFSASIVGGAAIGLTSADEHEKDNGADGNSTDPETQDNGSEPETEQSEEEEDGLPRNFAADLTGDQQVPPVETNAFGSAFFTFNEDYTQMEFQLNIGCIEDVTQAHIHLGQEGENGPVVVWLYPHETQEPRLVEGFTRNETLAEGTLTAEDLVGDLEGESLEILINQMLNGDTYVNVHTEHQPDGEIRGQIESA